MIIQTEGFTRLVVAPSEQTPPRKISHISKTAILASVLCMLSGPVVAELYTVDSAHDPASGNPGACSSGTGSCSLRDALAAADMDPGLDTVVIDVDETIYLLKQLTVETPVEIDGGKGTVVRVDQGYEIAVLPDKFDDDNNGVYEDVPALQPSYYSVNGTQRAMLELHGPGSSVSNMVLDGSITPLPEDLGVARIDWDSNDDIGNRLYSAIDEDGDERWLVAGGIYTFFAQYGPVNISNNEFRFFSANAVKLEKSFNATVSGNVLSVGVFEGIVGYDGALLAVADNMVEGFRRGIDIELVSGITVRANDSIGNRDSGVKILCVNNAYGDNLIEGNHVVGNANSGITLAQVGFATISGNTVNSNSPLGIDVKSLDCNDGNGAVGSKYIDLTGNDVSENGTDPIRHGGIRVAEGSEFNSLIDNKLHSNSGFGVVIEDGFDNTVQDNSVRDSSFAGILLLNESQGNTVSANHVEKVGYLFEENGFGILSFTTTGVFPSFNAIEENTLRNNSVADAVDGSPDCVNSWMNNKFRTALGPDDCIN